MSNDLRYCTCRCGQVLGDEPRAKYASGTCRVRAHRRRSVTSVTPEEPVTTPSDLLHGPSVTSVTGDTLYGPEPDEKSSWRWKHLKGLTYKQVVLVLKQDLNEVWNEYRRDVQRLEKQIKDLTNDQKFSEYQAQQ